MANNSDTIPFVLEIACFSLASALIAERAGANRIEFCDNPAEGGTTPSYGTLKIARKKLTIPVYPIIRPRGGHFVYSPYEIETMREDILRCRQLGYEGVVIGLLKKDGTIDKYNTAVLTELAYPMEVNFHRAFDRTIDPFAALEDIIACGCTRILTSGQKPDVNMASDMIRQLIEKSLEKITIMPGSGIHSSSLDNLISETGAKEYHASARIFMEENYFTPASMEEINGQTIVNEDEVQKLIEILNAYQITSNGS